MVSLKSSIETFQTQMLFKSSKKQDFETSRVNMKMMPLVNFIPVLLLNHWLKVQSLSMIISTKSTFYINLKNPCKNTKHFQSPIISRKDHISCANCVIQNRKVMWSYGKRKSNGQYWWIQKCCFFSTSATILPCKSD